MKIDSTANVPSVNDDYGLVEDSASLARRLSDPMTVESVSQNEFPISDKIKKRKKKTKSSTFASRMRFNSKKEVEKQETRSLPSFAVKSNGFFKEEENYDPKPTKKPYFNFKRSPRKSSRSPSAVLRILHRIQSAAIFGGDHTKPIDSNNVSQLSDISPSITSASSLNDETIETEKKRLFKNSESTIESNNSKSIRLFEKSYSKNIKHAPFPKFQNGTNNSRFFPSSHPSSTEVPLSFRPTSGSEDYVDVPVGAALNSWEYGDLECWMTNLPHKLQMMPLHHLLLPGSHDSFSYSLEMGQVGPDSPRFVTVLATCCPCLLWPAILRWVMTQRASITEQLIHGIRYFDIRVAEKNGRFYFVHGLYGSDLEPLLGEIQTFLGSRPGEVVILDFQHFYKFTMELHESFTSLLFKIFSGFLCPPFETLDHLTLSFLSKQRFQVLIFYREAIMEGKQGLWSSVLLPNPWPRATGPSELLGFIKEHLAQRSLDKFYVTQCVLTPSSGYLATNFLGSLESKLAVPCNKEIFKWIASLDKGDRNPNVIMTDFVEQDDWAIPRAIISQNTSDL